MATTLFQPGDRVVVAQMRAGELYYMHGGREKGLTFGTFIRNRIPFVGQTVTIDRVSGTSDPYYTIKEDGGLYIWTDEMFADCVEGAVSEVSPDDLMAVLGGAV